MTTAVMIDNIEVTRSRKRTRTVSARLIGTTLYLSIPARMSKSEEKHWVDEMSRRYRRKRSTERIDLAARARKLARTYALSEPRRIEWAENMRSRWGSCTINEGSVRLSTKLVAFPDWVLDYVIVHELAHLDVPDHSPRFWSVVARYPKAERARGFLLAKSDEPDDDLDDDLGLDAAPADVASDPRPVEPARPRSEGPAVPGAQLTLALDGPAPQGVRAPQLRAASR